MIIIYLIKQNKKVLDFVLLVADDRFVDKSVGKIGKAGNYYSSLDLGSPANAIAEIKKESRKLTSKGFIISGLSHHPATDAIIFSS